MMSKEEQSVKISAPEIELEVDEFLREVRGNWDCAARKHADWIIEENPEEDPQRVRNLLAEVALEEANEEREDAYALMVKIDQLQERLAVLRREQRIAFRDARKYQAAYAELLSDDEVQS